MSSKTKTWVPFLKNQSAQSDCTKVFAHFAQFSTYFARRLGSFARIFTKLSVLGVRLQPLHPRLLHQCKGPNLGQK